MKNIVIDIHAHFIPKLVYERYDAHVAKFPSVKLLRDEKGKRLQFPGGEPTRPISPKLSDLADRRAWMDKNGIDHQLVGGWLDSFGYELPSGEGLAWSRYYNDCLEEELSEETRFTPLATVPLQHGGLAAEVLAEALERGFGGVMIGTLPKGLSGNLDDPSLDPFWKAASDLGAAVVYYGTSPDPGELGKSRAPVLGLYGGDDARVNATVGPAEAKMKELGKTYVTHTYPGAGHGFLQAQDGRDGANLAASGKAWPATIGHLRKYLE